MPFTNNSITEEEAKISSGGPWPDGDYEFKITSAEEKQSSSGNDMIKFDIDVFKGASYRSISHFLVFTEKAQWAIRKFYSSIRKIELYESGVIDASQLIGCEGVCKVHSEEFDGKKYNKIKDFVKSDEEVVLANPKKVIITNPEVVETNEDDIPF